MSYQISKCASNYNLSIPHLWNRNIVVLTKWSSLAAPEVVIMTTPGAVNDDNFVKMKTFVLQWTRSLTIDHQNPCHLAAQPHPAVAHPSVTSHPIQPAWHPEPSARPWCPCTVLWCPMTSLDVAVVALYVTGWGTITWHWIIIYDHISTRIFIAYQSMG